MNQFAPRSEFIRRRAISLHRSGTPMNEISRMLHIGRGTVQRWMKDDDKKPTITRVIQSAELAAAARWSSNDLPTLAFVPHIELTKNSKYQMAAP